MARCSFFYLIMTPFNNDTLLFSHFLYTHPRQKKINFCKNAFTYKDEIMIGFPAAFSPMRIGSLKQMVLLCLPEYTALFNKFSLLLFVARNLLVI